MKKILILLTSILLVFPSFVYAKDEENTNLNLTPNATSAILMEYSTGKIIYNKDANKISSVASLTKMMGLIIAMETIENKGLKYNDIITVSENAKGMGGTQLYLDTGEKISVDDLLKGIVMASANDAMVALAERIAGTEEEFVRLMNEKTKEIGLKNTHFKNCVGFDEEEHYSTAYDMAIIAKELLKHEEILKYSSVYESYIRENTDNKTWVVNTNKLVRFYEGADGLKTGWTEKAGSSLAATAKKGDLRLIAVTLGYEKSNIRNQETMNLLDYGFNQYNAKKLYKKGDVVGHTSIDKSSIDKIDLVLEDDVITINKKTDKDIKYKYDIELNNISLPIKKKDKLGVFILKDNENNIISKTNLISKDNINRISFSKLYLKTLQESL